MDHLQDPRAVIVAMHHCATRDLLGLMDGFYSNLEDGLFELSFRTRSEDKHRQYFDLMRQMRHSKSRLITLFIDQLQTSMRDWFDDENPAMSQAGERQARILAQKSAAHYQGILTQLAERSNFATGRDVNATELPISPLKVAYHFLCSCRELKFDEHGIEVVQELFGRFVLERLGSVYGQCQQDLKKAGYMTLLEQALLEQKAEEQD
ncbi:MAG: DUF1631 family protein [Proteobacteria bacterium]|nr:DUF1631 family protein [Pseudomonadota bacterium]